MDDSNRPFLIVEDSAEDYVMLERAFNKVGIDNPLYHFQEGDEALAFLQRTGSYTQHSAPLPCFILLDLNLPGIDGRDVLRRIKTDDKLKIIPVIVYSTSAYPSDILACYQDGANCYIQKPITYADHLDMMRRLTDFWLSSKYTRLICPSVREDPGRQDLRD